MKRKDFDEIDGCFPSSSRKSRRLDGALLPFMQEDPISIVGDVIEERVASNSRFTSSNVVPANASTVDDGMPLVNDSEEKAMVLYCQPNAEFLQSRGVPQLPIVLNSDLLPGLKDHLFWPGKTMNQMGEENKTLAVVPWVPYQAFMTSLADEQSAVMAEPMEAEEVEMMDTEYNSSECKTLPYSQVIDSGQELQQWSQQQQHCISPQALQNTSTPVAW